MENSINLRKIALLAGAALLCTGAMAAPITGATETRSETVKYSTTNAATPEGAAALYQKLHETAARVCGGADTATSPLYPTGSYAACVTGALDGAVRRVGIPMVTAMHTLGMDAGKLAGRKALADKPGTLASR
jgi:UrcA family protein